MRIVAGEYRGRRLLTPKGRDVRPTSDKVRGAVFNALESRGAIKGRHVLDAFCGTGALGLEALSRGAASCMFADIDREALSLARINAENLGAQSRCRFMNADLTRSVRQGVSGYPFGLIFLDPPYRKSLILPVLGMLSKAQWIEEGALCVVESEKEFEPFLNGSFSVLDRKVYGDTQILLLCYGVQIPP